MKKLTKPDNLYKEDIELMRRCGFKMCRYEAIRQHTQNHIATPQGVTDACVIEGLAELVTKLKKEVEFLQDQIYRSK